MYSGPNINKNRTNFTKSIKKYFMAGQKMQKNALTDKIYKRIAI